eukprot:m.14221 g.14221  ORF g.14221 m.14221 type:complete len:351 (-) comp7709_c0_seq5:1012-2064(-)
MNGVETLAQTIAKYRKKDPTTDDEIEFMENIYDSLCSSILFPANKTLFMDCECVELMVLLLRERKLSRFGAIRVLDFILSGGGEHSETAAKAFIEHLGLAAIFGVFMKLPKMKKYNAYKGMESKYEEHIVTIIASLLRELKNNTDLFQRVIAKFLEKNFSKSVRLAELHAVAEEKLRACERELSDERESAIAAGEIIDEEFEDEEYLERTENGLSVLQQVDFIVAEVIHSCGDEMRRQMKKLFKLKSANFNTVFHVLVEYAENIGDETEGKEKSTTLRVRDLCASVFPNKKITSKETEEEAEEEVAENRTNNGTNAEKETKEPTSTTTTTNIHEKVVVEDKRESEDEEDE